MAYATIDELAAALRIAVTAATTPALQACLDAAAVEMDHRMDRTDPVPVGDPLANRENILRACEWWKANDFTQPSAPLRTPGGYVGTVLPLKQQWGVA